MPKRRVIVFGAYAANEPWPDLNAHYALEQAVGGRLPTMSWFQNWDTDWLAGQAATAATSGHDLLICWEPVRNGSPVRFADILAGHHDVYLRRYFTAAATFPRRVTIRPFHEMNGTWYPWGLAAGRQDCVTSAEEWIAAWRYLVALQRSVSGDRVRWAWCVNNVDIGGVPAEAYYPGSAHVDVLGLDGYNGWGAWVTPYQVMNPMYQRLVRLHPVAPVIIGEIASREPVLGESATKVEWLTQLFTETRLPRLTHINYFHANKERDWRLDSSPAALSAARRYLST